MILETWISRARTRSYARYLPEGMDGPSLIYRAFDWVLARLLR